MDALSTRSDLTYLQQEMLGEITVGHMFVSGPGEHKDGPKAGLLGADYVIESDRYKFADVVQAATGIPPCTRRYAAWSQRA